MPEIKVAVQLVPQFGDMATMRDRWREAEDLGADVIYTCDHFFPMEFSENVATGEVHARQPDGKNFEATSIQAAMAATTARVEVGCIVHANSYRNPNLMADMARTIDHISNGRFILGMGAGYQQRDYEEYGYEYGTVKSRLADLKRDLPIMRARIERLNPPPVRKIPFMVASMGEKVGLRIVAEHADLWHVYGPPEQVAHKTSVLKQICAELGRDFRSIELTTFFMPQLLGKGAGHPDIFLKMGFRHLIAVTQGPDWGFGILNELLAWRKAVSG